MCEGQPASHPELWEAASIDLESQGAEADLKMWSDAEDMLKLRKVWDSLRIGGVVEPEGAVRE